MAKDPATSRIPCLDRISRVPKPSNFGLASSTFGTASRATTSSTTTTQHIRPPTSAPKATQVFQAPSDPAKPRPVSSYAPSSVALRDLGSSLKKSASGERINNAVSLLSKRTTTALKKYFSPKSARMMSTEMTSSLPVTPLPLGKQRGMLANDQFTSSTPVPLLRSDTFVCEDEEQTNRQKLESTFALAMDMDSPDMDETKVLVRDGTRIMEDTPRIKAAPLADVTQIRKPTQIAGIKATAKTALRKFSSLDTTHEIRASLEITQNNATHAINSSGIMGRTMPVIQAKDVTRTMAGNSSPMGNTTKVVSGLGNTTQTLEGVGNITKTLEGIGNITKSFGGAGNLTKSMDREFNQTKTYERAGNTTKTFENGANLTKNVEGRAGNLTNIIIKGQNVTQTIDAESNLNKTIENRVNLTTISSARGVDLTKSINEPGDYTKVIHNGANLTQSMDQLPLLEHMSMPSGLDILSSKGARTHHEMDDTLDVTLTSLAPDKANMKLPLNSTLNTERLLDISGLPSPRHIQLLNLTQELERGAPNRTHIQSGRRSIPQHPLLCLSPQSATTTPHGMRMMGQVTPQPVHLLSPLLKQAQSALVLPTRTPDGDITMDGHGALENTLISTSNRGRTRYSFGLDLPDTTLDCSIELVDNSFSSSTQLQQLQQQLLKKQSSFDLDESLGILTPDQMKDFLDSPHNNLMHNLELIRMHHPNLMQLRMEQTPSPEELPLDPIEIKTEIVKQVEASQNQVTTSSQQAKLSNSFITSVTSVTSLDTGYQGDGEMSRPASRGACDHSPSNGPHLGRVSRQPSFPPPNPAPLRRQDPMTDSDFFTESDADDVLHRGDRRAQVIDGQLYGHDMMQPSASVPQMEDSCMESSGIFTDVENRCDEEMRQPELEVDVDVDMSPDDSTQTMRKGQGQPTPNTTQQQNQLAPQQRPPSSCLSSSSAATTLSLSLSNRTSYCSVDGGSARSFCDEAFATTATPAASSTATAAASRSPAAVSVQKSTSPRPHASLSSLCTVETFRGSVSSNSSIASPKSCKSGSKSASKSRGLKSPKSPPNRKQHTPNKWDAVMNKIASNKSLIKTNYNDVKSKVSSTRVMSPGSSSVSASGSGSGSVSAAVSSPRASPSNVSASARRSPSATPKVPPKMLLVKRSSSSSPSSTKATGTPHSTPPTRQPVDKGSVGSGSRAGKSPNSPTSTASPPAKRLQSTLASRNHSYSKDSHKSSHSDLSLLCNGGVSASSGQASASVSGSGSPKLLAKTPLRAAKKRDVRNLSISPTDLGPPPKTQQTAKGQSTRNKSSTTPTPTSIHKRLNGTSGAGTPTATNGNHIKGAGKATAATIKQTQQTAKLKSTPIIKSTAIVGISEESLRSGVDHTELQELNNGQTASGCPTPPAARDSKRSSIGSELPCETEAKLKKCEEQQETKEPALSVLQTDQNQAGAAESNAVHFNCTNEFKPQLRDLEPTISSMTMIPAPCIDITAQYPALKPYAENGVVDYVRLSKFFRDNQHERLEENRKLLGLAVIVQFMSQKLDAFGCQETKDQKSLEETKVLLQQTQRDCEQLREELHSKDVEWVQRQQELEHLHRTELKQAEENLMEVKMLAKQRFCELESQLLAKDEENKQVQQAYYMEVSNKLALKQEHLTTAEQKILDLQTRLQKSESQKQEMHEKLLRKENTHAARLAEANQREQELSDRVKSLTKELTTLKASKEHSERDLRDRLALSQDEISVLRTSSQRRSPCTSLPDTASAEVSRLTNEADSLRCVLELKQAEISALSKAKAEYIRESEERIKLSSRVALLEAQNEMMRTELEAKTEKEKDIQQKMGELDKAVKYERMKHSKLTFAKEELQYHLKQRSVQLQAAEAKLHELSISSQDSSLLNTTHSRCSLGRSSLEFSGTTSSPTSPVMKGMIERNDSVSWTLEIDDEMPKGSASKIVRRTGSLRSNSERCVIQRRQTSVSNGHSNGTATNGGSSPSHPNPLSQSMSATALLRTTSHSGDPEGHPVSRARSLSVCLKASASSSAVCESSSGNRRPRQSDELSLPDWHEDGRPLCSSSPQPSSLEMRPRSSTMKLMSSEAKKFQEIQESAGEAMVSGANSEDESCSASSEDMMRSSSASSTASGGSLFKLPKQPPSRMSIEEALPCTPMEVSWSEDAAADASGLA